VDFQAAKVLKPWWKAQGMLPKQGQVLAGSEAAALLGLRAGGTVSLGGKDHAVAGVLEPLGSQDDQMLFTDLASAQGVLGKPGEVSLVEVAALCRNCPVEDMVQQIGEVLPGAKVMAIQQVVKGRLETLEHLMRFSYGVSAVMLFVGSLMVLVTMMGSVRERTAEIGVFRALGFRKSHIMRIILTEAAVVSAVAGLLGYPGGVGVARLVLPFFTEGRAVSVSFDPRLLGGSVALALVVGLAASLYPALAAARLDPNEALRAL
jgi:putative ABC transport system permease protein